MKFLITFIMFGLLIGCEKEEASVRGVEGKQGIQGIQGEAGTKGNKGDKGDQGLQGVAGKNGVDGKDGMNGFGVDGKDGVDGNDGKDGVDGVGCEVLDDDGTIIITCANSEVIIKKCKHDDDYDDDGEDKEYLCHKGETLSISKNAVDSHIREHADDDYLGKCVKE